MGARHKAEQGHEHNRDATAQPRTRPGMGKPPPAAAAPAPAPEMSAEEVAALETAIGYAFADRRLVEEAMTHGSLYYPDRSGPTYERLEFVGDGVIGCVVARELFAAYPHLPPGPLTNLRAANVDKEKLARAAVAHGLHRFLRHNAPCLDTQISDFMADVSEYPIQSNGLLDAPKILSHIVESLIGAVYVDSNYNQEEVWRVFKRLVDPLVNPETLGRHPVSELNDLCQKTRRGVKIMKDNWTKNQTVEVFIDGELVGSATYGRKKEIAQNRAAKTALDRLKQMLLLEQSQVACQSLDDVRVIDTLMGY